MVNWLIVGLLWLICWAIAIYLNFEGCEYAYQTRLLLNEKTGPYKETTVFLVIICFITIPFAPLMLIAMTLLFFKEAVEYEFVRSQKE